MSRNKAKKSAGKTVDKCVEQFLEDTSDVKCAETVVEALSSAKEEEEIIAAIVGINKVFLEQCSFLRSKFIIHGRVSKFTLILLLA